jgi:serine/threonine-protein kinase RsbW
MENELVDIHTELASEQNSIQQVEQYIYELRDKISISDEKFYNILIAVTEAVNNAIIHGNKYSPDKIVDFSLRATDQEVTLIVIDQGDGFDPEQVSDPRTPENLFKEHGRGVFLIRQLADSVEYSDGGRCISLGFFL